ncbi:M1 family metallopeptidase [Oceanivirga salmonicida]|uniref:M1 family metallopeptidase n=1 Tax=Oceanivirga salmonicida TaxID=1769291 RepID=UPI0012E180D2|nr:M1 family metallopeptidase [Oceanivirga salmonicida]
MKVEHFIENFVPENYRIFLDINRKLKEFKGVVTLKGEALDKSISLHQKNLIIERVSVDGKELSFSHSSEREAVDIELLGLGNMTLVVEFTGKITDNMTGIYPSYYTENGIKKEVISTQFESHFAREAFPCIDEPEAKATFDLNIKFDQNFDEIVLSNMPEINIEKRKETGIWQFDTTPVMSTYLLAFAIGDLQSKISKTKNGTKVGIFATKAHPNKSLDFALDIAIRTIEFYEDYFGVKYPLPHSYHVALPDFSAGAMENWGLITYREIYLLAPENLSVSSRQQIALVIAHEVAHQWFGNLVTMKWWDDLWLNESFANMMEYVSIDAIEPTWNIMENFQTGGVYYALRRDATDGVQSVHVEVNHPDEINTLFDPAIVYAKGSRLMHMLRRWLGDKDFSEGLGTYFAKHKYSNTIGTDLWNALSSVSGKDVASFMNCWLEQPGYPLVTVKVVDDKLIISQKQFFIGKHEDKNRLWQIPLNSNWKGIPDTLTDEVLEIENYTKLKESNNGALQLNTENTAHYIINYEGELFDNLLKDFDKLDNVSKLQIIQDYKLMAESSQISFVKLLNLLPMLTNETSYLVTSTISGVINSLKQFIEEGSNVEDKFKNIVKKIYQSNFDRLGFKANDNETDEDEMVRQLTLSSMIYSDDENVSKKANEIFMEYKDKLETIPAAIRAHILINQIKHYESIELVNLYLDLYVKTNDSNFKRQLAVALSKTNNEETVNKVLKVLKNKDIVKPQDLAMSWYAPFLSNSYSQEIFWNWSRNNWEWIKKTLGGDMSFDKFVIYPASYFKSQKALKEYKEFFEPQLSDMALSRCISMGINEIEARVSLIEKEKECIGKTILEMNI